MMGMKIFELLAVMLLLVPTTVTVTVVSAFCAPKRAFVSSKHQTSTSVRATIYYPDGDGNIQSAESTSGTSSLYSEEGPSSMSHANEAYAELEALEAGLVSTAELEAGLASPDEVAPLARLVAATSHADVRNIQDMHVIELDGNHVEMAATVCEQESCVSLAVPLTFPHPCTPVPDSTTAYQQCILDNIHELEQLNDQQNNSQQQHPSEQQEQQAPERLLEDLRRTDNVELPAWWVHPTADITAAAEQQQQLANECHSLLRILNEDDFQADLRHLVATVSGYDNEHRDVVRQAAVVAVGPAGLVVRATVLHERGRVGDDQPLAMVELPIAFQEGVAPDSERLREAVLTVVEQSGTTMRN